MKFTPDMLTSRRALLLAAGAAPAAVGAGALMLNRAPGVAAPVGRVDLRKVTALDENFFVVDGWVLTADDVKALRLSADDAQ